MALVGQAAMVAQFAGLDAYGLIKMIAEAAQTVRRNRTACAQLARRAKMIGDLLHHLHAAHAQLMQQPETRNPMEQLEETLRRALLLVTSCRGRGYLYRCFVGARLADELRDVQGEISFYLQLFPLISYVDTTLTWVRLLDNKPAPQPPCKEAPVVRPYFVPFLFLSPDEWCLVVTIKKIYLGLASTIILVELLASNRVNAFASGESGICRAKIQVDSIQTAVVSRSFVDVQNRITKLQIQRRIRSCRCPWISVKKRRCPLHTRKVAVYCIKHDFETRPSHLLKQRFLKSRRWGLGSSNKSQAQATVQMIQASELIEIVEKRIIGTLNPFSFCDGIGTLNLWFRQNLPPY